MKDLPLNGKQLRWRRLFIYTTKTDACQWPQHPHSSPTFITEFLLIWGMPWDQELTSSRGEPAEQRVLLPLLRSRGLPLEAGIN